MTIADTDSKWQISPVIPALGAILTAAMVFYYFSGPTAWIPAIATAIMEVVTLAIIAVAAGGWGELVIRCLAPRKASAGLRAVSSIALGLWMLSTATLAAGVVGLIGPVLAWCVIGGGIVLAGWRLRHRVKAFQLPRRVNATALTWLILGACVGIWLAGAVRPPGFIGRSDAYDVMEYHLQAPREFYLAGHIEPLEHNAYSFYPLGVEMLFLLGMGIRGGAYEGIYLAKLVHGLFGVVAVAGIWFGLRKDDEVRSRSAAILLASAPAVLYLSWLAFVELAMICYLTLALLWLRRWLAKPSWRDATMIGVMLGAGCAMKYLSVLFLVAPVVLVMIVAAVRSGKRLAHLLPVALMTFVLFSPWLIRNFAATGNPMFPLATSVLGKGHLSEQVARRWRDGHAPDRRPPVPAPPGWAAPAQLSRLGQFWEGFVANRLVGPVCGVVGLLAAVVALCAMLATPGSLRSNALDWSLVGIVVVQLAGWAALTHGMPWRFITPAIVPVVLLAGGALARLAKVRGNPFVPHPSEKTCFCKQKHGAQQFSWGHPAVVAVVLVAAMINLIAVRHTYDRSGGSQEAPPVPAATIAREFSPYWPAAALPSGSRVLLVGDAAALYYPPGTIYATVFDNHPLEALAELPAKRILARLRAMGVTHILVRWPEIWRLAGTYGYPAPLSEDIYDHWREGRGPSLNILDRLQSIGMKKLYEPPAAAISRPPHWPDVTLYALPPPGAPKDWQPAKIHPPTMD